MPSFTEKYKKIIVPLIIKFLPDAKIILYGSRARHDDRGGSDIDIALDLGKKIDDVILAHIIENIEESALPINFDIVDFYGVSERMQQEIMKDGVVWKK